MFNSAKWIWLSDSSGPNQYICFRKKFVCRHQQSLQLRISADSDFVVYLNGERLEGGQFSDWPEKKSYTSLELKARKGDNVLAILAYYRGITTSCYAKGLPGLIAESEDGLLDSNASWKCHPHPAFISGEVPLTNFQLGYTITFDARKDLGWYGVSFDDSAWIPAHIQTYPSGYRAVLTPRPVQTTEVGRVLGTLVMQGSFIRKLEYPSTAETIANDYLRSRPYNNLFQTPKRPGLAHGLVAFKEGAGMTFIPYEVNEHQFGYYVVVDLQKESAGMLEIELTAPAGAVCDIAVGEHVNDGRVRAFIGGRNFADRYICKAGHNRYRFPFRRVAGRYIELHLSSLSAGDAPALHYLGMVEVEVELPPEASFKSNDELTNKIHAIAAHTLKVCMHEHYEDCPWREQALYAYDSRNQMLYGYYLWGNYNFAATSLELLGNGLRADGLLELCAPSHLNLTIPIFSMVWVAALAEYQLHSGEASLTQKWRQQVHAMIEALLPLYDHRLGLFACHEDDCHWPFYEWTPGLDGTADGDCTAFEKGSPGRLHAAFNLYLHEMLSAYLEMLHGLGAEDPQLRQLKTQLAAAIHQHFWDDARQCYASKLVAGQLEGFHENIQALALYNNIVPESHVDAVVSALTSTTLPPISFSAMSYLVRPFMEISAATRQYVATKITNAFRPMIFSGSTTLWETAYGACDFDDAGSLCHAWSSIPIYFAHAYTLGIRPLTSGFATFLVSPYPGSLYEASGTVATPAGFIQIKWTRSDAGLLWDATGPESLSPILHPYAEVAIADARYNGVRLVIQ